MTIGKIPSPSQIFCFTYSNSYVFMQDNDVLGDVDLEGKIVSLPLGQAFYAAGLPGPEKPPEPNWFHDEVKLSQM